MKNIIVTGASRGIGFELAKQHLELGNRVLTVSRNIDKLKELEVYAKDNQYQFIGIDLTNFDEIAKIVESVNSWEKVDILYNNAGICINKPFDEIQQ